MSLSSWLVSRHIQTSGLGKRFEPSPDRRTASTERSVGGAFGEGWSRKAEGGAPDRIRTCDLRLRRPTLYPLSYRRADGE
jgi:hypothetical protein